MTRHASMCHVTLKSVRSKRFVNGCVLQTINASDKCIVYDFTDVCVNVSPELGFRQGKGHDCSAFCVHRAMTAMKLSMITNQKLRKQQNYKKYVMFVIILINGTEI